MAYQVSLICIFLYFLAKVQGGCHECQSNFAVCHDEKRFTMCTEGISEDKMETCPNGYVCTDQTEICLKSTQANPVQPTCDAACGLCNSPDKLFACINEKTYAFCFGADSPDYDAMDSCPDGYVCNLGSREICTPATEAYPSCFEGSSNAATTLSPTTSVTMPTEPDDTSTTTVTDDPITLSPTTSVTMTTEPDDTSSSTVTDDPTTLATQSTSTQHPQDESAFCRNKEHGGFYKSENDPTCQEYIFCYLLSGQYLGLKYTCHGDSYFNENTSKCQAAKPASC